MTKKIKDINVKIQDCQRKLLKACVQGDEKKMIRHQHKLLRLNLALKRD